MVLFALDKRKMPRQIDFKHTSNENEQMSRFSWDDMQFFLALARDGHLTKAARKLGTSHVTVARRIDRLEAALHQRLFERSAKGYELTPAGRRLIATAEGMEAASETIEIADPAHTPYGGTLRLAVPEGFASLFATRLLSGFRSSFPRIALELVTLTQVLSLSRREADLTVTLEPASGGSYESERIAEYDLGLYASPAYLGTHPPIRSRGDLLAHPFLGYIEEMLFASSLDYLHEVHPEIKPSFKSSSILNQLQAAQQGLGLAVLPCYMAQGDPLLQGVLPGDVRLTRSYWLTCHRDIRQMRRERRVIAYLKSALAEQQGLRDLPA